MFRTRFVIGDSLIYVPGSSTATTNDEPVRSRPKHASKQAAPKKADAAKQATAQRAPGKDRTKQASGPKNKAVPSQEGAEKGGHMEGTPVQVQPPVPVKRKRSAAAKGIKRTTGTGTHAQATGDTVAGVSNAPGGDPAQPVHEGGAGDNGETQQGGSWDGAPSSPSASSPIKSARSKLGMKNTTPRNLVGGGSPHAYQPGGDLQQAHQPGDTPIDAVATAPVPSPTSIDARVFMLTQGLRMGL